MAFSSSSPIRQKHDVFISFRGEDTRYLFTSFLYEELRRNQIQAYMDDRELETGDEIPQKLMDAIEESKISVIIFSEDYASSTWCLNELVKILECKTRNGQIVIPVFYRIDPSIVRKQKESYAHAFTKHEVRFKDKIEKVNQWREALKDVADLSGLDSKLFRSGPMLVQKIVDDIWLQLSKKQTSNHLYKGLYGIEERINKIERLLRISSTDARIVGISGMGGIGKTTLASAIFQKLYPHFEGRCFLENVRDACAGHGLDHLRKKLLNELFNDRAIVSLDTPFVVSSFIGDRFSRKKVLIVLDDVDSLTNLEALIKGYEEVAPGSRIIVTARNAQVLKNVADQIYEVEGLDSSESLDLFHLHAFKRKSPAKDFEMLSKRVADYANGNPLALKVLGSFLQSRPIEEWESALKKLEMVPHNDIQKVLRISYEGLDDMERELFLDIACFFVCTSSVPLSIFQVESIVDEDSSPKLGMSVLNERSLVNIVGCCRYHKKFSMHNLLQQMGFAIVCEENKEPGNRSRLWITKDISRVLETASGTEKIKSISLHLCHLENDVKVSPAAFSKMSNLQYFQIISHPNAKFRLLSDHGHGLEFYPSNKLRYFCWAFYPYKSFPSGHILENLVQLNLTDSQLVEFWNEDQPAPALEKLKFLELHGSKNLTQIPNLSRAINIERICLAGCTSLVQLPSYFKDLLKLRFLILKDCSNLVDVEGLSKNLIELNLGGTAMEKFPEILEPMECLKSISLRGTVIKELPQSSIENLNALSGLDLSCCKNIEFLLNNLCCLRHIFKLDLRRCSELKKLPPLPHSLVQLDVRSCENLKSIQELPPSLTNLDASNCKSLKTISNWRRTPLIQEQRCFLSMSCSYRFDNCEKLDQNTKNYIIPGGASLEILSSARSTRNFKSKCVGELSIVFCYPGDDIPNYFISHIDPGTSINIKLPSNWCDANFMGFAFCFVLDWSEAGSERLFDHTSIECVYNFNDDGDVEYPCKVPVKWYFQCSKLNSDHVLILYDNELSYKKLQDNFGANWASINSSSIVTKASFDFRLSLHYVDGSKTSGFSESDGCDKIIIKKCGVWLIYDQEDGRTLMNFDQKPKEEETQRFGQLSQVSGGNTHEVVCPGNDKVNPNTAAAAAEEEETRRLAPLSLVSGASSNHEVVCMEDEKVNTNTEEDKSIPKSSAQEEASFTEWLMYLS